MSNPPKRKGTRGENLATRWLSRFWPKVERRALRGVNDAGDIAGTPFVIEVKNAERWDLHKWIAELEIERIAGGSNGNLAPGFLMLRRNHHPWVFLVPEDTMEELLVDFAVRRSHG